MNVLLVKIIYEQLEIGITIQIPSSFFIYQVVNLVVYL